MDRHLSWKAARHPKKDAGYGAERFRQIASELVCVSRSTDLVKSVQKTNAEFSKLVQAYHPERSFGTSQMVPMGVHVSGEQLALAV